MKKTFRVTGMACKHCSAKVTAKALSLSGVKTAEVALENGILTVEFDENALSAREIATAVTASGFPCEEA